MKTVLSALLGMLLLAGLSQANAITCTNADAIIDGSNANDCGWGSTTNDEVTPPPEDWSVNVDKAGGLDFLNGELWLAWDKAQVVEEIDPETGFPINNPGDADYSDYSEANPADGTLDGSGIDVLFTDYTGTGDELYQSGVFSFNVGDDGRALVVLKDGNGQDPDFYHWYYFEELTPGLQAGSIWNTGDFNISHLTVYTTDTVLPPQIVPVPAAVWLFGSGLLGLVGIARRRKRS